MRERAPGEHQDTRQNSAQDDFLDHLNLLCGWVKWLLAARRDQPINRALIVAPGVNRATV